MKNKKTKPFFLYYHIKWMKTGKISTPGGLCPFFIGTDIKLFNPRKISGLFEGFWGYDGTYRSRINYYGGLDYEEAAFKYTEFRQTIVLFLAAMNNEL